MEPICMKANLLSKSTIAKRISKRRKPSNTTLLQKQLSHHITAAIQSSISYEFLFELFRDSRKLVNGKYQVKDLSNLGRDLKNVVIVDDKPRSYKLQPENGFPIKRFIDDLQDDELKKLMDCFFKSCDQYEDLKAALKHYRDLNLKLRFKYCHS
nr:Dullard phosphatase domain, eukaryotic [Tanacetum cinerariifolium]